MNSKISEAINTLCTSPIELWGKTYTFKSYIYRDDYLTATHEGIDIKINLHDLKDVVPVVSSVENISAPVEDKDSATIIVTEDVKVPESESTIPPVEISQIFTGEQQGGYDGSTLNSVSELGNFKNQGGGYYNGGQNGGHNNYNESTIGGLSELRGKKNKNNNNIDFLHNTLLKGGNYKFSNRINSNYNNNINSVSSDYCE